MVTQCPDAIDSISAVDRSMLMLTVSSTRYSSNDQFTKFGVLVYTNLPAQEVYKLSCTHVTENYAERQSFLLSWE